MKAFKKIYIEITNVCNLNCAFCPKTERKASFMAEEAFEKILHRIGDYGKFLYFHVLGEPLLHPALGRFLDLCAQYGKRVNITTNGTLIGKAGEMLFSKPALRQVNFSLHCYEANEMGFSMQTYLDQLFQFISEARKRTGLLICLRLWNLEEGFSSRSNRTILNEIEDFFSLQEPLQDQLTPCRGIKLAENVFLNQAARFQWPDIQLPDIGGESGFCYGLRDQLAVLTDGTVIPCCLDGEGNMALGNLFEASLQEILEGPRARRIYEGFSNRRVVEKLCKKCGYRTRFD